MAEPTVAVTEAVVVAGPDDARTMIAGVPLLVRSILTLQRGGIQRVTLVGAPPPHDARIRCTVTSAPAIPTPDDDAPSVLVGAGSVIDGALIAHLQEIAVAGSAVEYVRDGARIRLAPARHLAHPLGSTATAPPRGTLVPSSMPTGALEQTLLYGLENPRDGYLDKILHRHFSRPVTRLLLRTPITPNGVTLLGIAIGVLGGIVLGAPGAIAAIGAVLLLTASSVLDCCDGELARVRFSESNIGHVLDVTGDTLVHLGLFAGIAQRLAATGAVPDRTVLWTLGLGVLGAFAAITWSEVTEERRTTLDCWENRLLANVLSPLTTRDWYVFPMAFALAGRLDTMVPAAAIGAHVFWVVTLVVLLRVLRRLPPARTAADGIGQ